MSVQAGRATGGYAHRMPDDAWEGALPAPLPAARAFLWSAGQRCSRPVAEPESSQYCAYSFTVDGAAVRFRSAKTTPTKPGQFVTVWQRSAAGPIRPFDLADAVDHFVIGVRDETRTSDQEHHGYFVFPAVVLAEHHIVSRNGVGGKRGFRLYPPWANAANPQSRRSQSWQLVHYRAMPAVP